MQAVIQYGKIVSWLEMEYGLSEKESKASESFLLAAFLNLAMCYLKLREYNKAVECCDKVGEPRLALRPSFHRHLCPSGCFSTVSMSWAALKDGAFNGLLLSCMLHETVDRIGNSLHPCPGSEDESRQSSEFPSLLLCLQG